MDEEKVPLLGKSKSEAKTRSNKEDEDTNHQGGLSLFFATLCIIDLFGVFPVVTMPRTIIDCGWAGLPLVFSVFMLQVYTALLLGRCWIMAEKLQPSIIQHSRRPYAALAELTYGETSGWLVTLLLDVTVFGAGVPNLLIASQNLQILGEKAVSFGWDISYCYWMPFIALSLCPVMWLGSPKDMKWLVVSSSCTVLMVSLLTWLCLLGSDAPTPPPLPKPSWEAIAIGYGVLAFQFDVHPTILTVQVDMADKKKVGQAVISGFFVTGSLFLVTCLLAAYTYGVELDYNMMQTLPSSMLLDINVLLVIVQVCLSMVVGATPLFQDLEDKLGVDKEFNWRRCALRSSLILLSLVLGEVVPRFDLIMGLIGGTLMGPLMFILPPLFYARLRSMEPQPHLEVLSTRTTDTDNVITVAFATHPPTDHIEYTMKSTPFHYKPIKQNLRTYGKGQSNKKIYKLIPKEKPSDVDFSPLEVKYSCFDRIKNNFSSMTSLEDYPKIGPMTAWEKLKTGTVIIAGLTATIVSTFFSVRETINYARFTPPCLLNVTAATLVIEN